MRDRKSAGDTIVEVLIAMAVASAVLGGAYAVVNRTMANARQAQEHAEALKLAQGQVERLNEAFQTQRLAMTGLFCLEQNSPTVRPSTLPACNNLGTSNLYRIETTRSGTTFNVVIKWDGATGGQDQVNQSFKVFER